jgi:hypothetical protein
LDPLLCLAFFTFLQNVSYKTTFTQSLHHSRLKALEEKKKKKNGTSSKDSH